MLPLTNCNLNNNKKNLKFLVEYKLCHAVNGIDDKCHHPMQLMTDRPTTCTQTLNPKPRIAKQWRYPNSRSFVIRPVRQIGIYKIVNKALLKQSLGYQICFESWPRPHKWENTYSRRSVWIAFVMHSCKRKTHKILHLKQTETCNDTNLRNLSGRREEWRHIRRWSVLKSRKSKFL